MTADYTTYNVFVAMKLVELKWRRYQIKGEEKSTSK